MKKNLLFMNVRSELSLMVISHISKIQLVVYHQCCILIGWATSRLYVIAH